MEVIDRKFEFTALNPCNGHVHTQKDALVLCAKDAAVVPALKAYRDECARLGCNEEHIASINLLIERVQRYQILIEMIVPDTVGKCELERCLEGKLD